MARLINVVMVFYFFHILQSYTPSRALLPLTGRRRGLNFEPLLVDVKDLTDHVKQTDSRILAGVDPESIVEFPFVVVLLSNHHEYVYT